MNPQQHPHKRPLAVRREAAGWVFEDPLGLVPLTPFTDAEHAAWLAPHACDPSLRYRLSQGCLLEDDHFRARFAAETALYASSPMRPWAGPDRARDPFGLRTAVAGMVADDWDMPPAREPQALLVPAAPLSGSARLLGRAFASIRHERQRFARVVLLGDARADLGEALVVEPRDHATPLGVLHSDATACSALFPAPSAGQLTHRGSTTLEPTLLFLRVVFPTLPIVAVLVSRHRGERAAALERLSRLRQLSGDSLLLCVADLGTRPSDQHSRASDVERSDALQELDAASLPQTGPDACAEALVLFTELLHRLHPELSGNTLGYAPLQAPLEGRSAAVLFQRASQATAD